MKEQLLELLEEFEYSLDYEINEDGTIKVDLDDTDYSIYNYEEETYIAHQRIMKILDENPELGTYDTWNSHFC